MPGNLTMCPLNAEIFKSTNTSIRGQCWSQCWYLQCYFFLRQADKWWMVNSTDHTQFFTEIKQSNYIKLKQLKQLILWPLVHKWTVWIVHLRNCAHGPLGENSNVHKEGGSSSKKSSREYHSFMTFDSRSKRLEWEAIGWVWSRSCAHLCTQQCAHLTVFSLPNAVGVTEFQRKWGEVDNVQQISTFNWWKYSCVRYPLHQPQFTEFSTNPLHPIIIAVLESSLLS